MSVQSLPNASWLGKNVQRREDKPLLMGRAKFSDDINLPRLGHAAVLGSPHAHAQIKSVDTSRAKALPGVYCVLTGAEAAELCGPLPSFSTPPVFQMCIAVDKVRHVGEPVAAVLAESRYIAEDAANLIEVEYEPLPIVSTASEAMAATGDAIIHEPVGSNIASHRHFKWGPIDEVFGEAAHVIRRRIRWPRVSAQPMETGSAVVDYDSARSRFTIYSNMSMGSILGLPMAHTLRVEPHQLNFITMHVGGSFGGKNALVHVPCIAALLSRASGRPARYTEDRLEHMVNGNSHASDREYDAELALDKDGNFTGLKLKVIDDYGAYFQLNLGTHGNALAQATGPYKIPALEYEVFAVLTNKTQQAAYRGFGGEVTDFVMERLVDAAATELGRDRLELRRKNFIRKDEFPYRTPCGNIYDSGDYHAVLDRALEHADLRAIAPLKLEARARNKRVGVGIATVSERSVLSVTELWMMDDAPPFPTSTTPESIRLTMDGSGAVMATIFSPHWGNSPETMVIQLVAENLSTSADRVTVLYGNTDGGLPSFGPAGSRYTVMIAGAIAGACRLLREKINRLAAHLLGVERDDIVLHDGQIFSKSSPERSMPFGNLAVAAHSFRLSFPNDPEFRTGLSVDYTYDHPYATMPNADKSDLGVFYPIVGHACHIVVVEIDLDTGRVEFLKYVAVHDAGKIVNPKLVDGQIRGGVAQGIGTALYEKYHYDAEAQPLTATFADYYMPTASEIPDIITDHIETLSPFTEFGIKGCGEGGRLASIPAIISAIDDAFSDEGLFVDELPVTPSALHAMRSRNNSSRHLKEGVS